MHTQLIISGYSIRQDAQGRFCLNDLHKAAGNDSKHKPANWLRTNQTKALIEEINHFSEMRTAVNVINGGDNRGTYVVKELVYSYAMWISATFHLHVIRAYDALINGQVPDHVAKAYDELVTNKIPITAPLPVAEFEERYHFHENALESLKNAQLIIAAKDFLSLKQQLNEAKVH